MEQMLLAYDFLKESIRTIAVLYKNMKVRICSYDRDSDFFNIVTWVLQEDTLAPNLFLICLDYLLQYI